MRTSEFTLSLAELSKPEIIALKIDQKKQFTKKVPYVCFDSSRAQSQITGYRDPQSRKVY